MNPLKILIIVVTLIAHAKAFAMYGFPETSELQEALDIPLEDILHEDLQRRAQEQPYDSDLQLELAGQLEERRAPAREIIQCYLNAALAGRDDAARTVLHRSTGEHGADMGEVFFKLSQLPCCTSSQKQSFLKRAEKLKNTEALEYLACQAQRKGDVTSRKHYLKEAAAQGSCSAQDTLEKLQDSENLKDEFCKKAMDYLLTKHEQEQSEHVLTKLNHSLKEMKAQKDEKLPLSKEKREIKTKDVRVAGKDVRVQLDIDFAGKIKLKPEIKMDINEWLDASHHIDSLKDVCLAYILKNNNYEIKTGNELYRFYVNNSFFCNLTGSLLDVGLSKESACNIKDSLSYMKKHVIHSNHKISYALSLLSKDEPEDNVCIYFGLVLPALRLFHGDPWGELMKHISVESKIISEMDRMEEYDKVVNVIEEDVPSVTREIDELDASIHKDESKKLRYESLSDASLEKCEKYKKQLRSVYHKLSNQYDAGTVSALLNKVKSEFLFTVNNSESAREIVYDFFEELN